MKSKIYKIGKSNEINLTKYVIKSKEVRKGWAESFMKMHKYEDDQMLIPYKLNSTWDNSEWNW
jgi:hypothetical protein